MEKRMIFIGIGITVLLGLSLLATLLMKDGEAKQTGITSIDQATFSEMMNEKDFTLINVHIPYAGEIEETDMFIPYDEIEAIDLPKESKIVLYCRSGSMSRIAAETLARLGYTNIYDLEGGMNGYIKEGKTLLIREGI